MEAWLLLPLLLLIHHLKFSFTENNRTKVLKFFEEENELMRKISHDVAFTAFTYYSNFTETNRQLMNNASLKSVAAGKDLAQRILNAGYDKLDDEFIQRQAKFYTEPGYRLLPEAEYKLLADVSNKMIENYSTATVCAYQNRTNCSLTYQPYIEDRLSNSLDPAELAYYWTQWQDAAGTPMRENYRTFVELTRKAMHLSNYTSLADYWLHHYDDPDIEINFDAAYQAILPLYKELHAYLRYRLLQHFEDNMLSSVGNIPKQLLVTLTKHANLYAPYPDKSQFNFTIGLQRMLELGADFFKSLNMRTFPESFWNASIFARIPKRNMSCHPSSWDMFQNSDVRIQMCAKPDMFYWYAIHHELGHIQYFLQYEHQPYAFRDSPNLGFHEAVGDLIALSATSQKHLERVGIVPVEEFDEERRINLLLNVAIDKILTMPLIYTIDKWRFAVFREEIDESMWNCAYWKMHSLYAGIEPVVQRNDSDFDPPADFHVSADIEVMRYFAATIFQFQFHKALCQKAGQYQPKNHNLTLDNCDIYGNKEAGEALSKFLSLGSSKHWKVALQELTGETTMSSAALLEYFEPLYKWLQRENRRLNLTIGWNITDKISPNCATFGT